MKCLEQKQKRCIPYHFFGKGKSDKGFTLVETLIYLSLYAIIMTGAIAAVYSIFESSAHNQTKALVEEEGGFLIGKVDWMLANATKITNPAVNASGSQLTVTTFYGDVITLQVVGTTLQMTTNAQAAQTLNNDNVQISCPAVGCFSRTAGTSDGINPEQILASVTVSTRTSSGLLFTEDFSTVKYRRQ